MKVHELVAKLLKENQDSHIFIQAPYSEVDIYNMDVFASEEDVVLLVALDENESSVVSEIP